MTALHVLVVAYRSSDYLLDCLNSLSPAITTVTIVDNASPGAEERGKVLALQQTDARITVHFSEVNLGFGAGVNLAARLADASADDVLWILNPDTVVIGNTAELLMRCLDSAEADIVSPLITTGPNGDLVWFIGGYVDVRRGRVEHFDYREPLEVALGSPRLDSSFISGAAVMMRVSTFRRLGGFPEDLFLYWEDAALTLEAARLGFTLAVVPDTSVWHAEGASSRVDSRDAGASDIFYRYAARNRIVVSSRYRQGSPLTLVLGAGTGELGRLIGRALLREKSGRLRKCRAVISGTAEGLRNARERHLG